MKKIIQVGLIVSGLASSLMGTTQIVEPIKYEAVKVLKDGSIELKFTSPYANPIINIESLGDKVKSKFNISLVDAEQDQYKITLEHKKKVLSCDHKIALKYEALELYLISNDVSTAQTAYASILYKPCYKVDDSKSNKNQHFETEHPYENNAHDIKVFPGVRCPTGAKCKMLAKYAYIRGETEKNYDFIRVFQDDKELGRFSGEIDEKILLNPSQSTTIVFTSDGSITKSGVTVDIKR